MNACPLCGKGELIVVNNIILEIEGYVFVASGERCLTCQEEFLFENETNRIIEAARKLGVWPKPLKLYRQLSKSGKGLVLRVPQDIEKQLKLKEGMEVAISCLGKKIVMDIA